MNVFTLSVLLVFGILLTYYGFLNVSVSCAPDNINDITQKYNNTYAIKVLPNTDSPDQIQIVKDNMNSAHNLMILSIVAGLYIIVYCIFEVISMWYFSRLNNKKQKQGQQGQQGLQKQGQLGLQKQGQQGQLGQLGLQKQGQQGQQKQGQQKLGQQGQQQQQRQGQK